MKITISMFRLSILFILLLPFGPQTLNKMESNHKHIDNNSIEEEEIIFNHSRNITNSEYSSSIQCNGAPFILPTNGNLRYIWRDPTAYTDSSLHKGLDIFGDPGGVTPVYAVYDGVLRRAGLSAVRIKHNIDSKWAGIVPALNVETYYTHMASADGSKVYIAIPSTKDPTKPIDYSEEVNVKQGQLIGYQGNYSGEIQGKTGTPYAHLHLSVNNGLNEEDINNTYDPSNYFGSDLNYSDGDRAPDGPIICTNGCQPTIKIRTKSWFQWIPWWKVFSPPDANVRAVFLDGKEILNMLPQNGSKATYKATRFVWSGNHTLTWEYTIPCDTIIMSYPNSNTLQSSFIDTTNSSIGHFPSVRILDWPAILIFHDGYSEESPPPPPSDPQPQPGQTQPPSVPLDNAAFTGNETIPQGFVLMPGEEFIKTWQIHNTGSTTWGDGYYLTFDSGNQMGGPAEIPLPATSPGQTMDISVTLVAPTTPSDHAGYWRLRNPSGTHFGPLVSVKINVQNENSSGGHISVFDVSPTSPSNANQVHIVGRIKSFSDFRSMRFAIGNEYYEMPNIRQVGDQLEISMDWQTGALPRGNYAIVFEIANNGDLRWTNPERRVITYALEGIPVAQNHAPDRPVLKSPYNWYLKDASGSPASVDICVNPSSDPDGDEVQYLFEVKDQGGGVYANSGWTGSTCWSHSYDPNTYSWRVKTWDGSAESDWSTDTWNFTVAKGGVYIGDITFYNVNTNDTHICVPVTYDGIQGPDVYAWLNKAPDNTETGEWRLLDHYGPNAGPDCNQPNVHGFWIRSPEYETGSHQLKVTAVKIDSGANQTKNTTYTIPFIRPSDVKILTPSTLTNNGTWWNTCSIDFQWSPSLRVENYTLRVSTNSNPWDDLNPIIDVSLPGNQTAYSQTFNQDYPQLYWSVRASNSEGAADSGPDTWFGIDQVAPTCQVQPLPATSYENVFQINFAGTDDSSGISTFEVQYKDSERDEWKDWISNQSATRPYELFIGQPGHTYYFRCRAKDLAGNTPANYPTAPDTWIKVDPQSRPVEPWFDSGYSIKRNLTIQNNMAGIELPAGYPVSLHFTSGTSPTADEIYNASQSTPKCNDIRVVFNNTTDLPRVIDTCTASDIKLWFRIQGPIPEGGIDNINYQLYYGNSSPAGLVGGRVFYPDIDGNSLRVYDMREGTGSTLHDAAGHGDAVMSSALGWAQGKWGPAVQFPTDEGPTPRPAIDDGSSYMPTNSFTIELWLKRGPVDGGTIAHQAVQYYQPRWFVSIVDNRLSLKVWPAVGSGVSEVRSARYLGESTFYTQFHHFAITFDGINKVRFYIDGQLDSERTLTQSGLVPSSSPLRIGASDINTARLSGVMFGFSLSEGVRTNFPEGSFAFITTEPSVLAGQIINPPSSGSPDLVVQSLTTYPYPGGGILVEALVLNQGNMSTQNGFYTDLYLDHLPTGSGDYAGSLRFWVNDPIDPNETAILTTVISDLQGIAGKSSFVTSSYTETSGVIYAQADSSGALMEQDKTNNIYFEGVEICIASPDLDEDDDESSTATPLQIGLSLTHNFDSPSDLDWIKFSAQAGNYYRIFTSDLGLSSDTYLYLYGSDGETLLLSNDDYGSTLASQIRWLAPADGDYYILVQHWNPNAAGCGTGYTISIDEIPEYYLYFPLILH